VFALFSFFRYNHITPVKESIGKDGAMLNNLILVGRLADDPKYRVVEEGIKVCNFILAVERPFQNQETGNYDVDFIPVSVWRGLAESVATFCTKGSTIGLKGRLAMKQSEVNGIKINMVEVIAERVSFIHLNSRKNSEEENVVLD